MSTELKDIITIEMEERAQELRKEEAYQLGFIDGKKEMKEKIYQQIYKSHNPIKGCDCVTCATLRPLLDHE